MHLMPLYAGNLRLLHSFIEATFVQASSGGVFANADRRHVGLFGVLKLAEAELWAYRATGEQRYLDGLRSRLGFCLAHRRANGINNFWPADFSTDSNWIESNHSGIFAHCAGEYQALTGDDQFAAAAVELMAAIPLADRSPGAFVDGYDNTGTTLDDRQYVADNTEIMLGWWACHRLTGEDHYRARALQVLDFLDANFRSVGNEAEPSAWLVGPKHVRYGEGSDGYCDTGHTTYEQFFASRNLLLLAQEDHYHQVVASAAWVSARGLFPDGFVGYNGRDDKMVGWTAYFAAHAYWAYRISGEPQFLTAAHRAVQAVLGTQDTATGEVAAFLPVTGSIRTGDLNSAAEGLGTVWQLAAVLQGLAIGAVMPPAPASVTKDSVGASRIVAAAADDTAVRVRIALGGSGLPETVVVRSDRRLRDVSVTAPPAARAQARAAAEDNVELTYLDSGGELRLDIRLG